MSGIGKFAGHWEFILTALGGSRLAYSVSRGTKNSPCPFMGHEGSVDGFRFMKDWHANGGGVCNTCGVAFNGIKVLSRNLGIPEPKAYGMAMRLLDGNDRQLPAPKPIQVPSPSRDEEEIEKARKRMRLTLRLVRPIDQSPVEKYLKSRGILILPEQSVHFHPELYCKNDEKVDYFPAMVSEFTTPSGELVTIHRTYLDEKGKKAKIVDPKKILPPAGKMTKGSIKLFDVSNDTEMGIAEGIETALSATYLFGIKTWSCYNTQILKGFEPPKHIKVVHVFADYDLNDAGLLAANEFVNRMVESRPDLIVKVHVPPGAHCSSVDWNDYLGILNMIYEDNCNPFLVSDEEELAYQKHYHAMTRQYFSESKLDRLYVDLRRFAIKHFA